MREQLKYLWEFGKGQTDQLLVDRVNGQVLASCFMPVVRKGALVLEASGPDCAVVAKRAAALFNDGDYSKVVMVGGARVWRNAATLEFSRDLWRERYPLPQRSEREAEYLRRVFTQFADPQKFQSYQHNGKVVTIAAGRGLLEKVKGVIRRFPPEKLVQAVTPSHHARRLLGIYAKVAEGTAVTVCDAGAIGWDRQSWHKRAASYAAVMAEAEVLGLTRYTDRINPEGASYRLQSLREAGMRAKADERELLAQQQSVADLGTIEPVA